MDSNTKVIRCAKCDNIIGCLDLDTNTLTIKRHGREIIVPMNNYVKIKCEKCEMINKIELEKKDD